MGDILDWIFGNIYFVIIFIWILFSMLSRAKKAGQGQAEGQDVGQGTTAKRPSASQRSNTGGGIGTSTPVRGASYTRTDLQGVEPKRPLDEEAVYDYNAERVGLGMQVSNFDRDEEANNTSRIKLSFDEMTSKELVQGVVWAEVLGAPRAKRPNVRGQ